MPVFLQTQLDTSGATAPAGAHMLAAFSQMHALAAAGLAGAYFTVLALLTLGMRRESARVGKLHVLLGAYLLASGLLHLIEAGQMWWPMHREAGMMKLTTAVVSWATVLVLIPVLPWALAALRRPDDEVARLQRELESLRALTSEPQQHEQNRNRFLATLAHELKTPLAPVRTALDVLRISDNEADLQQCRLILDRQVRHLVRLTEDLLDVFRVTRNEVTLRREPTDLCQVVREAVESSRPFLDETGHEFALQCPDVPLQVDADPVRLTQVVQNLLQNACKYTRPPGQIRLSVERAGDQAVITLQDTGLGIPPEMLGSIFEMFTQSEHSLPQSLGRLGIGLSLVSRIVELHGGTIEARSPGVGQGSEFIVRLPLLTTAAEPDAAPDTAGPAPSPPPARFLRILVVDDSEDTVRVLGMLLRTLGHEVHTATSGNAALAVISAQPLDAVIADINMPGLNGYEVAQQIRALPEGDRIRLIALTGWGHEKDRERSRDAGFDHHLVKPVSLARLEEILTLPATP